ncbi:nicotinate-nucleotide--dimethylbenzimidazole phosphoribosyltransferase, partial [Clostridioides difficile]|uniref:nicotinate-nucleotide--dimethylbenzimidazole phosphoribosyltransferase n=1 Tax=Clostridioides difficile TaxID=1496 RepID=UPI001A93237C
MSLLESISKNIYSLDNSSIEKTKQRLDRLIHPTGSLGKIEDICMHIAGICSNEH